MYRMERGAPCQGVPVTQFQLTLGLPLSPWPTRRSGQCCRRSRSRESHIPPRRRPQFDHCHRSRRRKPFPTTCIPPRHRLRGHSGWPRNPRVAVSRQTPAKCHRQRILEVEADRYSDINSLNNEWRRELVPVPVHVLVQCSTTHSGSIIPAPGIL